MSRSWASGWHCGGVGSDHTAFPVSTTSSPRFCNPVSSRRIFSDVAEDVTFPLVSRCGRVRKMVVDSKDPDISKLELVNVSGGALAFELAAKFCYGSNFEITEGNVAHLRCISEYMEMTEDYQEENLIVWTETYLNEDNAKAKDIEDMSIL